MHAGERGAPREDPLRVDVGMRWGPTDCGAVVLALARDAELITGPSARSAPLPIVDGHNGEPFTAEPFRERLQPACLHCAHAVCHDHRRVWALPDGLIKPGV